MDEELPSPPLSKSSNSSKVERTVFCPLSTIYEHAERPWIRCTPMLCDRRVEDSIWSDRLNGTQLMARDQSK
ncbi:unnamed protein product [Soboliphyme baturini]|uniref:Uncharacterized protein n=1 Tax=Soboliphyme baturini TaxID=241478 RepID=A0A183IH38_9BILA|nr:unnamed protein product [Soboliphyme baturini]